MRALRVDKELSPLVRRSFSIIAPTAGIQNGAAHGLEKTVLRTEYNATTNRMLRVAVNGFMESLTVVLGIMEQLDVDILEPELPK
jgi:EKC/KEOPS complex subunit PCC1/LAGE3